MPTLTLRPSFILTEGDLSTFGNVSKLTDDSDATYMSSGSGVPPYNSTISKYSFAFGGFPAGSVIKSVTPRFRWYRYQSTGPLHGTDGKFRVRLATFTNPEAAEELFTPASTFPPAFGNQSGATRTISPSGVAWTTGDIANLDLWIGFAVTGSTASDDFGVAELYIDVVYNQTAVISGVTVAAQLREDVPITWTFTDAESDTQTGFEVKIFTSDVVAAGGFDPNTSAYAYASGFVSSASPSYQANANLSPGHYRAYVRAQDTGTDQYTNWASSSEFRIINSPLMVM